MADQSKAAPSDHPFWKQFESGFATRTSGAVRTCLCGRVFYNPSGGWDWEDGELDSLEADPKATGVDWACGEVRINGKTYARDCDCWHEQGRKILEFVLRYDEEIADFLNQVKAAKTAAADRAPSVKS